MKTLEFLSKNVIFKIIIACCMFLYSLISNGQNKPIYKIENQQLYNEIVKMDSIYFDAYNNCKMDIQEQIFDNDVEFIHDKSGLLQDKSKLLKSI